MKVNNDLSASFEELPLMGSQSEAVPSNGNIHRRPVPTQTSGTSSSQDNHTWDHSWEDKIGLDSPQSFGESEATYNDHDTHAGIVTPSSQSHEGNLALEEARCSLLPYQSAAWFIHQRDLKLSTLAAAVLIHEECISFKDLEPYCALLARDDSPEPTDPLSGALSAAHGIVGGVLNGVADYPIEIGKMLKADQPLATGMAQNFALDTNKGVSRIIGTGLKAPMDVTLGVAKGFGNLPKAYGDETVREKEKVTGIGSGLMVAGKGFGFGLYDGISGLVTQPLKGAQQEGALGFMKGFAKGIGGAVCKPVSGVVGLPAYAFKGIYEEVHKSRSNNVDGHVIDLLLAKGEEEWKTCGVEERSNVLSRWHEVQLLETDFLEGKYQ
ncbi:Vacuolar protein sorting-associated protein [Lachnellula subtilissima]|uniref:Vacuolar protein sorting-associated protein n=1 Tax=Lachnellula subtilissima TaxID=602034 RepID=A0A8H8UEK6_9HELO|nr:Vacuolar protein sorting-associated protein [Lachnellula subtilissima]